MNAISYEVFEGDYDAAGPFANEKEAWDYILETYTPAEIQGHDVRPVAS